MVDKTISLVTYIESDEMKVMQEYVKKLRGLTINTEPDDPDAAGIFRNVILRVLGGIKAYNVQ